VGRISTVILAVLVCLLPARAHAYVCKVSEDFTYVSLHWPTRLINYAVATPGSKTVDGQTVLKAVDGAFAQWALPDCTDIRFVAGGVVDPAATEWNKIEFVQADWPYMPDAVALTQTRYGTEDGIIREATIFVNEDAWRFTDAAVACNDTGPATYDLQAVLTHEAGHLIGLDHTQPENYAKKPSPTMAPDIGVCEMDKRVLKQDDIDGLCVLYPKGQPSGNCETIPQQSDPYVTNTPLGCTETGPHGSESAFWAAMTLLALILMGRKRPKTCPRTRDGR
jgi:hypothetical protein